VEEAKAAVHRMNRNSAPGSDGFGPGFYMAAWDTVVDKVMSFVDAFAAGTVDLEWVNRAYIVLLPKKSNDTRGPSPYLSAELLPEDHCQDPHLTTAGANPQAD